MVLSTWILELELSADHEQTTVGGLDFIDIRQFPNVEMSL